MERSTRFAKYILGAFLGLAALTNCFGVSSYSTPPSTDASRAQSGNERSGLNVSSPSPENFARERNVSLSPAAVFSRRSATVRRDVWPLFLQGSPTITATKTDNLNTSAHPGDTLNDTIDPNTTLVVGSVAISPIAVNDTYNTIGNVNISVPVLQGVIANDLNPNGSGALTVTKVNATNLSGGTATTATTNGSVTILSDGSFNYTPNAGFSGPSDSFTYTLDNGTGKTDTGTVTINVSGRIWFVNSAAGVNGDGRLNSPFNILTGAAGAPSYFSDAHRCARRFIVNYNSDSF